MATQMSGVKRAAATERWYAASDWYRRATESEIDAQVRQPIGERTEDSWARIAVIALDQADIDASRLVLR